VLIPQGVETLPAGRCPELPDDAFVVLLPAALRPVKNVEFPLRAMAPLCGVIENLLLVIAGGVIDQVYAACIREMLSGSPFARWLGEVPYERMGSLYARADVVLNCSRFEGMPNSLMEAMALGRPVLAAAVPGNCSLVCHETTGFLYRDEADFRDQVVRLAGDPGLCANLGKRARDFVLMNFPPKVEAERYLKLYIGLLHDLP
jgi:glycosyltransferase involved in cell wall biosynthesis